MPAEARYVGCDIDSTMCDHWRRIRRHTLPSWPGTSIAPTAWSRDEVLKDRLLPYCLGVLRSIKGLGLRIRYVTARGWKDAHEVTIEQLRRWGVPDADDVILVPRLAEKVGLLEPSVYRFYIDDFTTGQESNIGTFHAEVAHAIQAKGVRVMVFRGDWRDIWEQIQLYEARDR